MREEELAAFLYSRRVVRFSSFDETFDAEPASVAEATCPRSVPKSGVVIKLKCLRWGVRRSTHM
jgi:hypothetical protein